jgi:hypothetical protein
MKTPYCGVLGIQRREVDQIRIAISVAVDRADGLGRRSDEIARTLAAERALAVGDRLLPENGYFLRMHAERARVDAERRVAEAQLDQLRAKAREAYGSMKAVEGAAATYRDDVSRLRAAAEQAATDDRAAADFVRGIRRLRATGGRTG